MKKIKIMKQQPAPSDEEIKSYMNFDALLEKRKLAIQTKRTTHFLKWSMPALLVIGLVGWYLMLKNEDQSPNVDDKMHLSDSLTSKTVIKKSDSLLTNEEITKSENVVKERAEVPRVLPTKKPTQDKAKSVLKGGVYVQAEPVDGYDNLYNYFNTNLVYPPDGLKDSIQGIQTVSFVINVEGKPESITVSKSLGEPFEKHALMETSFDGWQTGSE
jgi:hypothetical protein